MISIQNKEQCCGCGACEQTCPQRSIVMEQDSEGFLYPRVNKETCINCEKCLHICPQLNIQNTDDHIIGCYAGYAQDTLLRYNSSSGGIFGVIAKLVLEKKGVVYGSAFEKDFSVHHIRIDNISDLPLLQGSKYVHSIMGNTYKQVKNDLDLGIEVLFSGTACQIAGLRHFIGKDYKNLLTIDILCHGVPSPMIWQLYVQKVSRAYKSKIVDVNFRSKEIGWKQFALKISFDKKSTYFASHNRDIFMKTFLENVCLRPSCYACIYKNLNRHSDITIGDAWGINKLLPTMDDNKGTSIIITHTDTGEQYIHDIATMMVIKKIDVDTILPKSSDSRKSVEKSPYREIFFKMANIKGYKVFRWWLKFMRKQKFLQKVKRVFIKHI